MSSIDTSAPTPTELLNNSTLILKDVGNGAMGDSTPPVSLRDEASIEL
jgi:hypothetical protein